MLNGRTLGLHGLVGLAAIAAASAARADVISASTIGNALESPDYYRVSFAAGAPSESIASVTFTVPFGFFDFDGDTSFMDAMAPVLHLPSLSGLSQGDVTFSFVGDHPTSLTLNFVPGTFGVGDSLAFGADLDDAGSKIGGVFGAGGTFSAMLLSGPSGTVPFVTQTSIESAATLTLGPVIPEPGAFVLGLWGVAALLVWMRQRA